MELWIRSQDKEVLININHLYLEKNIIVGYCQSTFTSPKLGEYKTKERALEILDEIQEVIDNGIKETRYDSVGSKYYKVKTDKKVYEMPEE